jgi:hypothetical protein
MPAAVIHAAQPRQQVRQEYMHCRTAASGRRLFQRIHRVFGTARALLCRPERRISFCIRLQRHRGLQALDRVGHLAVIQVDCRTLAQ